MLAKRVMVDAVECAHVDDSVREVLPRMRAHGFRMLPVIDDDRVVVGVFSTYSVLEHIAPSYVASGNLDRLAYAPDLGILRRHFEDITGSSVRELMDCKPLFVNENESMLSVAAALISHTRHEYALVVDHERHLKGVISAGDILDRMQSIGEEEFDA